MAKSVSFTVGSSLSANVAVIALHLLVVLLVCVLSPPWYLLTALNLAVLLNAYWLLNQMMRQQGLTLRWDGQLWHMEGVREALTLKRYFFFPSLMALEFASKTQQIKPLMVFPDAVSRENWRNIRRACQS